MSLQEIFIANLRKYRKQLGISQMKLSIMCDTSTNYIGQIEMGRRIPSFEKIEQFAAALKISPSQFFTDPDSKENKEKETEAKEKILTTKEYLQKMPPKVKKELLTSLMAKIKAEITGSLDGK